MKVIQINKAFWPGIYPGAHSIATEHALNKIETQVNMLQQELIS
jgi:hypothetical protein